MFVWYFSIMKYSGIRKVLFLTKITVFDFSKDKNLVQNKFRIIIHILFFYKPFGTSVKRTKLNFSKLKSNGTYQFYTHQSLNIYLQRHSWYHRDMHAITQKFTLFYNPRLTKIIQLPKSWYKGHASTQNANVTS